MSVNHFIVAFNQTMVVEGLGQLSNNKNDPGKMTYSGISRVYWPEWSGWTVIDEWVHAGCGKPEPLLLSAVQDFYRINFWNRIQGDKLAAMSPLLAYEVFDTAVNMDVVRAVRFLQVGFNVGRGEWYEDLLDDGKLGPKTLDVIQRYLNHGDFKTNEEILLNCMNGEQYIFYKGNPRRRYFRGWFRRV